MTTTQKIEIFGDKEKELKKKFEKDGYKWKEIKETLAQINEKEQIDTKLTELEGNVNAYYDYLKGLIEKYKNDEDKSLVDKAKTKVEEKVEQKKQEIKTAFKEKLKKIPVIGGILVGLHNWVDESEKEVKDEGFWKKTKKSFKGWVGGMVLGIIGGTIGGIIGYNKLKEELNKVGDKASTVAESITGKIDKTGEVVGQKVSEGKEQVGGAVDKAKEKVENLITPEKRRNAYSIGGVTLIKYLSGVIFEKENTPPGPFYDKLKDIPFKKIYDSYDNYKKSDSKTDGYTILLNDLGFKSIAGSGDQKGVESAIESIVGENSKNIIFGRLSNFHELVSKKDSVDKFGKEFINNISNKKTYEELTLKEISILFAMSTPAFVKEIGANITSTIGGMYGDFVAEAGAMKEEFTEKREDLVSKKLLENFISKSFGTNGLITSSKEGVFNAFGIDSNSDDKETKQLEKIIEFKDVIIEKISNNKNFTFNMDFFKEKFMSHLRYNSIVELYLLLNGESGKLDSLDLVSKAGVIFIIRDSFKEDSLIGEYEGRMLSEFKKSTDDKSATLTEKEKLFINKHISKFSKKTIDNYVKFLKETRGGIKDFLKTEIQNVMGTEIPNNATNIGEYALLASAAGVLWRIKSFTPAGIFWTGAIGVGSWTLSILTETELYKDRMAGKITFSDEINKVLDKLK